MTKNVASRFTRVLRLGRLATLVAAFAAAVTNPAFAASNTVPTIAAMQALGASSSLSPTLYVVDYAHAGDGGGGEFIWDSASTTTTNTCTVFAATGVGTGRWLRQMQGRSLNVDMCGTGNADDSGAFTAAFAQCAAQANQVVISAKFYTIRHNLVVDPACGISGALSSGNGGSNTYLDFTNDADGGACFSILRSGTPFESFISGNSVGNFVVLGNGAGSGTSAHCTQGIYVSRVVEEHLHDVKIFYVNGPCLFWGQSVLSTIERVSTAGCGTSTTAQVEIYGETDHLGGEFTGTTLYVTDLDTGADYGNSAQAGVKIDRWGVLQIRGGSFENAGIPLMVGSKTSASYGVGLLTITGVDFEDPTNGASNCATFGTGWTGTAGQGVINAVIQNNACAADATSITSHFIFKNTTNMYVTGNQFHAPNSGTVILDFQGTGNAHENAFLNDLHQTASPTYVKVNGTTLSDADPLKSWSIDNEPVTVAGLVACSAATRGTTRYVTDATATLTAGIGAVVAGSGANIVPVGCDGTNWRIGG